MHQLTSQTESTQQPSTSVEVASDIAVELVGGALACAIIVALFFWIASLSSQGPVILFLQGLGVAFAVAIMACSAVSSGAQLLKAAATRRHRPEAIGSVAS